MNTVKQITVSVGSLPEWYNEAEHDFYLEDAIQDHFSEIDDVEVEYNYNKTLLIAYDDDGDVVFENDHHDLAYAFAHVLSSI